MPRRRHNRLVTVILMVLPLLFAQWALALYVCPTQGGSAPMAAMADRMAAGEPCDGMDQKQPVLCHQQATGNVQSFEAVKLPVVSLPIVVLTSVLPLMLQALQAIAMPVSAVADARPPPDPVFLSTLRLRV